MADKEREQELLDQMARLAGRINRHKAEQKAKERRLLDDVARLAGKINRHKQEIAKLPENEQRGLKRAREEAPEPPGVPVARFSKLSKHALENKKRVEKSQPAVTKKAELCKYYTQFGKCNNYSKCPFQHDPQKVSVCPAFLRGECHNEKCLLRHKDDHLSNRMPVCVHFLKGTCTQKDCPYLHVKVDDDARLCPEFQKGFCPRGPTCSMKHEKAKKTKDLSADPKELDTLSSTPISEKAEKKTPASSSTIASDLASKIIPSFAFD